MTRCKARITGKRLWWRSQATIFESEFRGKERLVFVGLRTNGDQTQVEVVLEICAEDLVAKTILAHAQ